MDKKYTARDFFYTDPSAYDDRVLDPIEGFIASCWDPILHEYLNNEIKDSMVVADLGCGTFVHTKYMGKAKHIYAVDINQDMLDFGAPKIEHIRDRVTVLCESGTKTSIPSNSCDLVWIDGLSEFIDLEELFIEVKRILKAGGRFIILYQNKFHPENILVAIYYWLMRRKGKKYRSVFTFKKTAAKYGFHLDNFKSTAVFIYFPKPIQKRLLGVWRIVTSLFEPLQKYFPVGNNIICEFTEINQ